MISLNVNTGSRFHQELGHRCVAHALHGMLSSDPSKLFLLQHMFVLFLDIDSFSFAGQSFGPMSLLEGCDEVGWSIVPTQRKHTKNV